MNPNRSYGINDVKPHWALFSILSYIQMHPLVLWNSYLNTFTYPIKINLLKWSDAST